MPDTRELLRTHEVAERLGITPRQVYEMIDTGELQAVTDDGIVKVPADTLAHAPVTENGPTVDG